MQRSFVADLCGVVRLEDFNMKSKIGCIERKTRLYLMLESGETVSRSLFKKTKIRHLGVLHCVACRWLCRSTCFFIKEPHDICVAECR